MPSAFKLELETGKSVSSQFHIQNLSMIIIDLSKIGESNVKFFRCRPTSPGDTSLNRADLITKMWRQFYGSKKFQRPMPILLGHRRAVRFLNTVSFFFHVISPRNIMGIYILFKLLHCCCPDNIRRNEFSAFHKFQSKLSWGYPKRLCGFVTVRYGVSALSISCLLYTSDAADE